MGGVGGRLRPSPRTVEPVSTTSSSQGSSTTILARMYAPGTYISDDCSR